MSYITLKQASRIYKVSSATIYRWVREDRVKKKTGLYFVNDLQKSYDKRRAKRPKLRCTI